MTKSASDFNKTTNKIFLLALSVLLVDMSILYLNESGKILLNQVMLIPLFVSVIFGFFHGLRTFKFAKFVKNDSSALTLIFLTFMYTAWYNAILLPVSGLGILEWILFAVVIFSDFLLAAAGKNNSTISFIGSSDVTLTTFGALMCIFKFVVYVVAPDNIYLESFTGNQTARFFVLLFCVVGLISLISFLYRFVKSKVALSDKQKNAALSFFKKLGKLFLLVISGPGAIVVLFCILFIAGIVAAVEAIAIGNDILNFIEPLLIAFSSTGKSAITPSIFYFILQFFVVVCVLIFSFAYRSYLEKSAENSVEGNLKLASKV